MTARQPKRIALYGGTFDPIHNAHLAVAKEAAKAFRLDELLVIPNAVPPHKQRLLGASYAHRLRMVELAVANEPILVASSLERAAQTSYSILTIEKVMQQEPGSKLFFLIGADAFADIETWFRWTEVLRLVTFLVVGRPGFSYDVPASATVESLETLSLTVSSSAIRKELAETGHTNDVPPAVAAYIQANGLYRATQPTQP